MELTPLALKVLEKRYLWRDAEGQIVETPEDLFRRVAEVAVVPESRRDRKAWQQQFLSMMMAGRFLPNSPTLMNAGKSRGQLSACFVLPVGDSLSEIFEALKQAAEIHQSGGGTGFSFSQIRQKGSTVGGDRGIASGPVSFVRIFDIATETIKQGGVRRGANMGVLRVDHPDIEEFVDMKRDRNTIRNFNISVGVSDAFMKAAALEDGVLELRQPIDGRVVRRISAKKLFDRIAEAAWECGDPGLIFLDRIERFNPTPKLGRMESTNPCGEQPLLSFESCNLGSLNLGFYVSTGVIQWNLLREDVWAAVRFLDNIIEENYYPIPQCHEITHRNRKIGLGVMGFADALLWLGLPYDSQKALVLGERLMSFVDREAKAASASLAKRRGPFANWKNSLWHRLGYPAFRNATVSTVAPTGTISLFAGASSGIEPLYASFFRRNVLETRGELELQPIFRKILQKKGVDPGFVSEEELREIFGQSWRPAHEISAEWHIQMQAAFQRHSDSAVSKTINLPEHSTVDVVKKAYRQAFWSGCKGITIYRDKSRSTQILESTEAECPRCLPCRRP